MRQQDPRTMKRYQLREPPGTWHVTLALFDASVRAQFFYFRLRRPEVYTVGVFVFLLVFVMTEYKT